MELVTGFQGKNHVTAAQIGRLLKGLAGSGNYVLETQNRFAAELLSVNKVSIGTGDLVADGRYFTNEAPEELTIENGAVGLNRNDLVVCRYTKAAPQTDEDGNIDYTVPRIEDGKFAVVKGTPSSGTPEDPEITTAPTQDNNTDLAEFPIWRLPIRGLSVETPEPLFKILQSADAFRDSQSQWIEIDTGDPQTRCRINRAIKQGEIVIDNVSINVYGYDHDINIPNDCRPKEIVTASLYCTNGAPGFARLKTSGMLQYAQLSGSSNAMGQLVWTF